MANTFEELDSQPTSLGDISLRRRRIPSLGGREVFEVKLGDEFLMSSLFHDAEVALADLALARLGPIELDVVVGGLGLGYTAVAALKHSNVQSLIVVEYLRPVIDWHRRGLVPLGPDLVNDPRCRIVQADFFETAASPERGFDPDRPARRFHAVLLDIDHTPRDLLHKRHGSFYDVQGLCKLRDHFLPEGIFALWSNDPPDAEFLVNLRAVFADGEAHVVNFQNPLLGRDSSNTIYVGRNAGS